MSLDLATSFLSTSYDFGLLSEASLDGLSEEGFSDAEVEVLTGLLETPTLEELPLVVVDLEGIAGVFELEFLKNHIELSSRIIVVDNVTNDTILQGLNNIMNAPTGNSQEGNSFGLPLAIGIVIGLIVGVGCGILILKKKK